MPFGEGHLVSEALDKLTQPKAPFASSRVSAASEVKACVEHEVLCILNQCSFLLTWSTKSLKHSVGSVDLHYSWASGHSSGNLAVAHHSNSLFRDVPGSVNIKPVSCTVQFEKYILAYL